MTFQLQAVSPQFFDNTGHPLSNGYIYIGTANLNPETNPIATYWDLAGTIPAAQPFRTINGAIVRNGTIASIYTAVGTYSLTVRDNDGSLILSIPQADNSLSTVTAAYQAADAVVTAGYQAADAILTATDTALFQAIVSRQNRNFLYNGDFSVAQQATTQALTTTCTVGSMDCWGGVQVTVAAGAMSQIANTGGTRNFYAKVGRNNGSALTNSIKLAQALESKDSIPLAGQTVVFSFSVKKGANYSGGTNNLIAYLFTGTGTDQSLDAMTTGSWTGQAFTLSQTPTLTTSFVRYDGTVTIPTSTTQIGVQFEYAPTGVAGADDNFYVADVQLEIATVNTVSPSKYDRRPYEEELRRCERYYQLVPVLGHMIATAGAQTVTATIAPRVVMRTTPTVTQRTAAYLFGDVNVTAGTSTYSTAAMGGYAFRTSSAAGQCSFSELIALNARL